MVKNDSVMISSEDLERIKRIKEEEKLKEKAYKIESQEKIKKIEAEKKQLEILSEMSDPNKKIFQKELKKHKAHLKYSGVIFNVYKDTEKKYTRFIFSAEDPHFPNVEFLISGIENNINGKNFSTLYDFEFDDKDKPTILFINGEKFKIYNPDANEENEEKEKEKKDLSLKWIERLSFYKGTLFQRTSNKTLEKDEVKELIEAIQESSYLSDKIKFLLINKIKEKKKFNFKDMRNLQKEEEKII